MSTNDITGDKLISKSTTDAYRDGFERIYGKKNTASDKEKATNKTNQVRYAKILNDAFEKEKIKKLTKEQDCT